MSNEANEVFLSVPIGNHDEVGLIAALNYVATNFLKCGFNGMADDQAEDGVRRAVNWLHAKYGSTTP